MAILNLAYLVSFVDRTILSLLIEPIKADLGISDTQIALVQGAAFGLFYTLLGIPLGWAVDRYSRKKIIGFGCTLWCLMTAGCGLAGNFVQLFLARMGVGLGEAALSPGAASMIADLFPPQKRALAMSVYAMGGSIGVGVSLLAGGLVVGLVTNAGPAHLPLIGTVAPWQEVLIIVGLSGLVVAAAILLLPEPQRRGAKSAEAATTSELLAFLVSARGQFANQFGGVALFGLVSYALLSWVPALFTRVHGWTAEEVGLRYGAVFLVFGAAGALAGGWLTARFAARGVANYNLRVAAIGVTVLAPFGIAAPLVTNAWLALALMGPVAFCFAVPTGASIAAIQEVTPNRLRGQVAALYYLSIGFIGLMFGPLVVALLTDRVFNDPQRLGWSLALVCAVMQPIAAWLMWRAVSRSLAQQAGTAA